jgi:hypothetical protein
MVPIRVNFVSLRHDNFKSIPISEVQLDESRASPIVNGNSSSEMGTLIFHYYRLLNTCISSVLACGARVLGELLGLVSTEITQKCDCLELSDSRLELPDSRLENYYRSLKNSDRSLENSDRSLKHSDSRLKHSDGRLKHSDSRLEAGNPRNFQVKNLKYNSNK